MLKNLSLKVKILLISIGGVLIISLSSFTLIIDIFSNQEKLLKEKFYLSTIDFSNSVQDQFYERYGDVKTFSLYFKGLKGNSSDYINYLNQVADFYNIYDLITVVDLNGKLLYINDKSPDGKKINAEILLGKDLSNYKWFKETLNNKFLEDTKKDFTKVNFQDAEFNELLEMIHKDKNYTTIFSTYIYDESEKPIAIISCHANFKWIENIAVRSYENFFKNGITSADITMLNKSGYIILKYSPNSNNGRKEILHDDNVLNKINAIKNMNIDDNRTIEDGIIDDKNKNSQHIKLFKNIVGNKIVDELGWKVLIHVDKKEAYSEINKEKITFIIVFMIIFIVIVIFNLFFGLSLSKNLMSFVNKMYEGNKKLNKTSIEASDISRELSSSSTEQAASLQETVSAVNEISAMMNKSSEMASLSLKKSDENRVKIMEGKKTVDKMVESISIIKSNNQDVLNQVLEGNKKISEIVKVISEIEHKTKVIDEIVFQTKLLSFNASVEAARAGEHGKGFSVVAEEVGNLAHMSGNASKEISIMLENSIEKVKKIIEETKGNVENILASSKNGIQNGETVSKECEAIFEKILVNTDEFNSIVHEIANSSQEQAKGINEINIAMHELDSVTHQNSSIAQKSSQTSTELLTEINEIEKIAINLLKIIKGNNKFSDINDLENKSDKSTTQSGLKNQQKKIELKENEIPSYNDSRFEDL